METNLTRVQLYKLCPIPNLEAFLSYRETGKLTPTLAKQAMLNRVVGKDFEPYGTTWKIFQTFKNLISYSADFKGKEELFSAQRLSPQQGVVKYRGTWFFAYTIKKKMGKRHHTWLGGSYADWTVSDVTFDGFPEDFSQKMAQIDETVDKAQNREIAEENRLYELFSLLADFNLSKGRDPIKTEIDIDHIKRKGWKLRDRYEKEHAK